MKDKNLHARVTHTLAALRCSKEALISAQRSVEQSITELEGIAAETYAYLAKQKECKR